MINITRRQFLQYCTASAAALGLSQTDLLKLEKALAAPDSFGCDCLGTVPVIWLSGQACSGCVTSLLNRIVDVNDPLEEIGDASGTIPEGVVQDVGDLLIGDGVAPFADGYICNIFNMTVMASCSDLAVDYLASFVNADPTPTFVLLVEGATPLGKNGRYSYAFDDPLGHVTVTDNAGSFPGGWHPAGASVTMAKALQWIASKAAFIVNIGTCSSFGGIPAAATKKRPTTAYSTEQALTWMKNKLDPSMTIPTIVNVPGCPPNPDWMIYPVAYYLIHTAFPDLDSLGRPTATYPGYDDVPPDPNCNRCSKIGLPTGVGTDGWVDGCLRERGCNGIHTFSDCPIRQWNRFDDGQKNDWCVGGGYGATADARHPCQGCVQPDFPDGKSPFYEPLIEL